MRREGLFQDPPKRVRGEVPVPRGTPLAVGEARDAGDGDEEHAPRRQNSPEGRGGGAEVVDHLKGLGEDDAVEGIVGNPVAALQVGDDRRLRVRGEDVEDVRPIDAVATDGAGVEIVLHLEHPPADVLGVLREVLLDVVAVDGSSAVGAVGAADRHRASEVAEPDSTPGLDRGRARRRSSTRRAVSSARGGRRRMASRRARSTAAARRGRDGLPDRCASRSSCRRSSDQIPSWSIEFSTR